MNIQKLDAENDRLPKSDKWWFRRLEFGEETNTVVHVAVHAHTRSLVGYIVTTWATHNTIRIDRLLVGKDFRRIRVGSRMLLRVLSDKPREVSKLAYVVPEQDLETQLFLKSVGFNAKLPLRQNAFPDTESGVGIKFEWIETTDAV
jgi:hypothetical protein